MRISVVLFFRPINHLGIERKGVGVDVWCNNNDDDEQKKSVDALYGRRT